MKIRSLALSLAAIAVGAMFSLAPASAQYRTGGGYHHQDGGPSSDYIADCVDRLPAWGHRNPCARHHGRRVAQMRGRQVQTHRWSHTTTRRVYLGTQVVPLGKLYVPRDGGKSIFVPVR